MDQNVARCELPMHRCFPVRKTPSDHPQKASVAVGCCPHSKLQIPSFRGHFRGHLENWEACPHLCWAYTHLDTVQLLVLTRPPGCVVGLRRFDLFSVCVSGINEQKSSVHACFTMSPHSSAHSRLLGIFSGFVVRVIRGQAFRVHSRGKGSRKPSYHVSPSSG